MYFKIRNLCNAFYGKDWERDSQRIYNTIPQSHLPDFSNKAKMVTEYPGPPAKLIHCNQGSWRKRLGQLLRRYLISFYFQMCEVKLSTFTFSSVSAQTNLWSEGKLKPVEIGLVFAVSWARWSSLACAPRLFPIADGAASASSAHHLTTVGSTSPASRLGVGSAASCLRTYSISIGCLVPFKKREKPWMFDHSAWDNEL